MTSQVRIIKGSNFFRRVGTVSASGTGYVFVTFSRNTKDGIKQTTCSFPASHVEYI